MNIEDIIARNIANLRKSNNLTQEEFANDLNYTFQAVSRWETGKSLPNAVTLKIIADYFNVSIEYLYLEHDIVISKEIENKLKKREIIQKIILIVIFSFCIFGIIGIVMGMFKLNGVTGFLWSSLAVLIISLALTLIFKKKKLQLLTASLLLWDFANCLFYQFDNGTNSLYMVFFFAMFGQIFLILLWVLFRK
ncbi:MAG: helix-turn-helix domain-containing protein [Bacilli bacterium]